MTRNHREQGSLTRRRLIKAAAAPASPRPPSCASAARSPPIPTVRCGSSSPTRRAARPTSSPASWRRRCRRRWAARSSSRTGAAPAAISAWALSRAPIPTATPSCSRPAPIRSIPASTTRCPTIRSRISSPICELAVSPHVFAVKPDLGAKTMKEFVALAKANPDKFNVSTPPIGTTPQLQAEVLEAARRLAGHGDGRVRGRRRRAQGAARRHRAAFAPACWRRRIRRSRPARSRASRSPAPRAGTTCRIFRP